MRIMTEHEIKGLLYKIYSAGYEHGINSGPLPSVGTFEAFERLLRGQSPLNDNTRWAIEDKVKKLFEKCLI